MTRIINAIADFGPGAAIAALGVLLIVAGIVPGAFY